MTMSLHAGRRLKRVGQGGTTPSPSLREVCLIGLARPAEGWTEGDRVTVSGRAYRVGSSQTVAMARTTAPGYVHLVPAPETG